MTTPSGTQRKTQIVIGLDRTAAHDDAVLTAAFDHAGRANADLCIVHALAPDDWPPAPPPDAATRYQQLTTRHAHVRDTTAELRRRVAQVAAHDTVHHDIHHDIHRRISYDVRYGDPATVLLTAAQHADLIIVATGSGSGRGSPLLLGTVSQDIAVHATCPILLIPPAPTP